MTLGPLGRLSSQDAIKLLAAGVVGYIAITGRQVDPLILTALLSALAVTPAPRPPEEPKPTKPAEEKTTDDRADYV